MIRNGRFVLLTVTLAAIGCREGGEHYHDIVEREERFYLEDQLYAMQDQIETLHQQLESCRRENDALRQQAGQRATGGQPSASGPAASQRRPADVGPIDERALPEEIPDIQIDPGIEIPPGGGSPLPLGTVDPDDGPALSPTPAAPGPPVSADASDDGPHDRSASPSAVPRRIEKIVLNRWLTGGYDADHRPGDDGVLVVIEPRDAAGELVRRAAPVDIAVLDPALRGTDEARVALWHFDTVDAAAHLKKTALGDGLHFELPWPNRPPQRRRLRLMVRYTVPDGRKLVAEKDIEVELTPEAAANWRQTRPAKPTPSGGSTASRVAPAARSNIAPCAADAGEPTPNKRSAAHSGRPVWKPYR